MTLIDNPRGLQSTMSEVLVLLDLEFGIVDVEPSDDLLETGHLDSLGLFELVLSLEESFGLALADRELTVEHLATVDAIVELIGSATP